MPTALVNAKFNATGDDGLPAIVPATDGSLTRAVVETIEGQLAARQRTYVLPGIGGQGVQIGGLVSPTITWLLSFRTSSIANARTFENKLRRYLQALNNYELVSEMNESWPHCRLELIRPIEKDRMAAGDQYHYVYELRFRDMQPRTGE